MLCRSVPRYIISSGIGDFQGYRGWKVSASRGLRPREGGFQLSRAGARAADESVIGLSYRQLLEQEVTAEASANILASGVERLPSVTNAYTRQIVPVSDMSF